MAYKSKGYKEPVNPVGNVAELFAGVGGFRIGLARAGWKTVFSNQWEPATKVQHASDVYVARFGEDGHSNEDISCVESLPKNIDLLVGGFPCQDYSVAKSLNSSKGLKGKKGVLWWEILRLVQGQKPKFIFLENVDRLLKSPSNQRGRDFAVMLKTLGDEGYTIEWRVVNAAEYGFPQRRIRVFIVATKKRKTAKKESPKTIIQKSGILARALPLEKLISELNEIVLDEESFQAGTHGIKSTEKFYINQSHNSILASLHFLNRDTELLEWMERASQADFPDTNYYKIQYLCKNDKYDEALDVCDSYYGTNSDISNVNRADILTKAKRYDDAETIYRKMIANWGPKNEYTANYINTFAFSVLIPQKRYQDAEKVLVSAICTKNERERINAFSNLAMVALYLKEFTAAARYASMATAHPDNAIASESRLTLCKIEYQRLIETEGASDGEWNALFQTVREALEKTDFDDAANFLEILIQAAEKTARNKQIIEIIESEFSKLRLTNDWNTNTQVRNELESIRIDILSKYFLKEKKFLELDDLFLSSVSRFPDQNFLALVDYLRTPFAGIDLRRATLKMTNSYFLSDWARFEDNPEILFSLAKHQEEPILVALAENAASPDAVCELISEKNDIDLDFALCGRPNLSAHMNQILARSTFEAVRKLIALRDDLAEETYRLLATDSAMLVRDAITNNQTCPAEIRALAALGSL